MKIYTKKGDTGQTSLFGGGDYSKDHPRITSYGTVDELNSVLGCVMTELTDQGLKPILMEVQKQLFRLGAELATLEPSEKMQRGFLQQKEINTLEQQIDAWEQELAPLTHFILPGGHKAAAGLHLARTVCRRAERMTVRLFHQEAIRVEILKYLNRLSDWLFVFARLVNHRTAEQDVLWEGI